MSSPVADALGRLADRIQQAQAADPLARVTVIVPLAYAGLHVRRRLGLLHGGLANVDFRPLGRLAEGLAEGGGGTPLLPHHRPVIVRLAMRAAGGRWARLADHPGTVAAVDRTLRNATDAGSVPRGLEGVAAAVERAKGGFRDDADVLRSATARLRDDLRAGAGLGTVLDWMPRPGRSAAEREFRTALGAEPFLPVTDCPEANAYLGVAGTGTRPSERAMVAPDAATEVRLVVTSAARLAAEGLPLHRIAILAVDREPYARLVTERLADAGLPVHSRPLHRLRETPFGRALRTLVPFALGGGKKSDLLDYLRDAVLPDALPSRRWARSVEATPRAAGLAGWPEAIRDPELATWLTGIVTWAVRRPRDWSAWSAWLIDALAFSDDPRDDDAEAIRAGLASLADLAALEPHPDIAAVRASLTGLLDSPGRPGNRYGDGLFLASPDDAYGLEFDAVFLLGSCEGTWPPTPTVDPLWPDGDRNEAACRAIVGIASASAPLVIHARPELDPTTGAESYPSRRWPAGEPETALSAVAAVAGWPLCEGDAAVNHRPWATTELGWETVARARDRRESIGGAAFGPWDGAAGPMPVAAVAAESGRPAAGHLPDTFSATMLESFGRCPRQFFFRYVLGLGPDREATEGWELPGDARGDAWHGALAAFFRTRPAPEGDVWSDDDVAVLGDLLEEFLRDRMRSRGVRASALSEHAIRQARKAAAEYLAREPEWRGPFRIAACEEPYEGPVTVGDRRIRVKGTVDRIEVRDDGGFRTVRIVDYKTGRSRADLPILGEPTATWTDVKALRYGGMFQLPLYGIAVAKLDSFRGADVKDIGYHYPAVRGERPRRCPPEWIHDRFVENVDVTLDACERGFFPATGDRDAGSCRYCDFRPACSTTAAERWVAKRAGDPLVARLAAMHAGIVAGETGEETEE